MDWIKVDDRMPEINQEVIAYSGVVVRIVVLM
jgi:hypothetical protein